MKISRITRQCIRVDGLFPSRAVKIFAGVALCAAMTTAFAAGPDNLNSEQSIYQSERANCLNGHSNQDRATCLKEAGAAHAEAKRGRLSDGDTPYQQNATMRCQKLDSDARQACERRMSGEGVVSGSVAAGGLYRELTVTVPAQ
jgi:hypothetical protein